MSEPKEFTLTDDHLKLLRAANVRWDDDEWGAPAIDSKRPYGNSSLLQDLAKILEIKGFMDHEGEEHFSLEEVQKMRQLHSQTAAALQIVLATGEFKAGCYRTSGAYSRDWSRV